MTTAVTGLHMAAPAYFSFLLRLWQVDDGGPHWRLTLENVESGERHGFTSLEALLEYLKSLEKSAPATSTGKEINMPEKSRE